MFAVEGGGIWFIFTEIAAWTGSAPAAFVLNPITPSTIGSL